MKLSEIYELLNRIDAHLAQMPENNEQASEEEFTPPPAICAEPAEESAKEPAEEAAKVEAKEPAKTAAKTASTKDKA